MKRNACKVFIVIALCVAILMPVLVKSMHACHHCKGEDCRVCEVCRHCEILGTIKTVIDEIEIYPQNLSFIKVLGGLGFACPATLTSLHVRLDN